MGLFDALFLKPGAQQITDLAEQISHRSCAAVWQRVQDRALTMVAAEARGYLHAHAGPLLEGEVQKAVTGRRGFSPQAQREVVELARQKVVETLLCEIARMQKTAGHRRLAA